MLSHSNTHPRLTLAFRLVVIVQARLHPIKTHSVSFFLRAFFRRSTRAFL